MATQSVTSYYNAATQFENLGDIVLAVEIIRHMRSQGRVYIDDRDCPDSFLAFLALADDESAKASKSGFKRNMLFSAIGSFFTGNKVRFLLKPGHMSVRGVGIRSSVYTIYLHLLKLLNIEIARYGASISFDDSDAQTCEFNRSKAYKDYTVRDLLSLELATNSGIKKGLPLTTGSTKIYVAGSFRADINEDTKINVKSCTTVMQTALDTQEPAKPLLVSQVYRDDDFNASVARELQCTNTVFFDGSVSSNEALFDAYEKTSVMISNRLHVLLFCASRGALPIPYISLTANAKVANLFISIGLEELIFDYNSERDFAAHIRHISSDIKIREKINAAFQQFAQLQIFPNSKKI